MHYARLAKKERYYLCQALKSGKSMREAAKEIGRNVSTVSHELARNTGLRGYRDKQADAKSRERQACKGKNRISAKTWLAVEQRLRLDNSPEQISGVLALQGINISHEWIYQHILAGKKNGGSLHPTCVASASENDDTAGQTDADK